MLLRRFPIAYVKLGHPFIDDLATDDGQRRLIWSTVFKAHRLGQRVIAQGVEDLATLEQLADLGIDEAQGYTRPVARVGARALRASIRQQSMRLRRSTSTCPEAPGASKPARLQLHHSHEPPRGRMCSPLSRSRSDGGHDLGTRWRRTMISGWGHPVCDPEETRVRIPVVCSDHHGSGVLVARGPVVPPPRGRQRRAHTHTHTHTPWHKRSQQLSACASSQGQASRQARKTQWRQQHTVGSCPATPVLPVGQASNCSMVQRVDGPCAACFSFLTITRTGHPSAAPVLRCWVLVLASRGSAGVGWSCPRQRLVGGAV